MHCSYRYYARGAPHIKNAAARHPPDAPALPDTSGKMVSGGSGAAAVKSDSRDELCCADADNANIILSRP
jgi:hypothetical protein